MKNVAFKIALVISSLIALAMAAGAGADWK